MTIHRPGLLHITSLFFINCLVWYIPLRFRLTNNPFSFIFNLFHFNSHNDFSLFSLGREHYFLLLLHCVFSFNIGRRQANLNSLFYGVSGNTLPPTEDIKLPWREEARLHAAQQQKTEFEPQLEINTDRPSSEFCNCAKKLC